MPSSSAAGTRSSSDEIADVRPQPVQDCDCRLRVADPHVDVQPEDQLAARRVLHGIDDAAVARLVGELLVFVIGERVRACRAEHEPGIVHELLQAEAELAQLGLRRGDRFADGRLDFDLRLKELGADRTTREGAAARGGEDCGRTLHEVERGGSSSMNSSSIPSVNGGVEPKACAEALEASRPTATPFRLVAPRSPTMRRGVSVTRSGSAAASYAAREGPSRMRARASGRIGRSWRDTRFSGRKVDRRR